MNPEERIPRDVLAVHEAGHVVAAVLLGTPVRAATVDPDGPFDPSQQGHVELRVSIYDFPVRLLVGLAGLAAETLYGPDPRPDATFLEVLEADGQFTGEDDLDQAARTLEQPPLGWPRRRVARCLRAAFLKVQELLRDHEVDVRLVADRLRERGTLRGEELEELLSGLDAVNRSVDLEVAEPDNTSDNTPAEAAEEEATREAA